MSGGSFDYNCYKIQSFASELQHRLDVNNDQTLDHYGDKIGYDFAKETVIRLEKAQKIIKVAGKLAREIEWLYSGDHGEHSVCGLIDKILSEMEKS